MSGDVVLAAFFASFDPPLLDYNVVHWFGDHFLLANKWASSTIM